MADDLKCFDPRGIRCRQRRGRSWFRFVDGQINVADAIAPNGAKELVVSIVDVDVGGVRQGPSGAGGHGHGERSTDEESFTKTLSLGIGLNLQLNFEIRLSPNQNGTRVNGAKM